MRLKSSAVFLVVFFFLGCSAVDRPGRDAEAYARRARIYFENDDYEQAIAYYDKAVELTGGAWMYVLGRAGAYLAAGRYDAALADYSSVVERYPNRADFYHTRAIAYRRKGEFDKAIADCTKAIEIEPKNASAYN